MAVIRHIEGILLWGMGAMGLWWVFTLIAALLIRSPLMPVLSLVPLLLDAPLFWIQPRQLPGYAAAVIYDHGSLLGFGRAPGRDARV